MYVVATAGHVDHGKSALVRALTGSDPDRWAEEKRRGLTIDLGFAFTTTASGAKLAFVDVPGHQRFIANMLAGLGPAPVVMFVVAADSGWQAQSSDHRDVIAALGIDRGLVVVTKSDLAPDSVQDVIAQVRTELASTGLANSAAVAVSARTGDGLDELRSALATLIHELPEPDPTSRVRFWVDRSFTVKGAGTVVTGTLPAGAVAHGDHLELLGKKTGSMSVRGIESSGESLERVGPVSRVALNLRGVSHDDVGRGDALVTPGAWRAIDTIDVRRVSGDSLREAPEHLVAHVGTAAVPVHVRPLGDDHARLVLERPLPLSLGDRMVLRDPGRRIVAGVQIIDPEPMPLRRRGAATQLAEALAERPTDGDCATEVKRRATVRPEHLGQLGFDVSEPPPGVLSVDVWWVDAAAWDRWAERLRGAVETDRRSDPLSAGLTVAAAKDRLGLPDVALLGPLARKSGLRMSAGRICAGDAGLGALEPAVAALEAHLKGTPFEAPTAQQLSDWGLGVRQLAAAERAGRIIRIAEGVVLLPTAPALAMGTLATLDQPFTASQARQALGSSRRVVIPLLELLDAKGWTCRDADGARHVVR
ncbi:selenocysteine-specific elongation factor [Yimella lutea]|uniref:Selenocysteine-specific elongation factor n=1 Tax=Yimella lutea TaxID=587872 RepID=A0A542EFK7_9MICO|nr:selenocysteine-specific translation elongation factor [Yimella lutea]TQJ14089.1 selenocysteine-specific elongation factor [Yimella lutea]